MAAIFSLIVVIAAAVAIYFYGSGREERIEDRALAFCTGEHVLSVEASFSARVVKVTARLLNEVTTYYPRGGDRFICTGSSKDNPRCREMQKAADWVVICENTMPTSTPSD